MACPDGKAGSEVEVRMDVPMHGVLEGVTVALLMVPCETVM